jgi:pimeloyl-ACP methyl ester carboxylesterase
VHQLDLQPLRSMALHACPPNAVTHWPAPLTKSRPVLCLPGLTRNGRDFADIAASLSGGEDAREVYALDARGRGLSITIGTGQLLIPTETQDVIDVMTASIRGDPRTSAAGSSPWCWLRSAGLIGAVVLNDIGR